MSVVIGVRSYRLRCSASGDNPKLKPCLAMFVSNDQAWPSAAGITVAEEGLSSCIGRHQANEGGGVNSEQSGAELVHTTTSWVRRAPEEVASSSPKRERKRCPTQRRRPTPRQARKHRRCGVRSFTRMTRGTQEDEEGEAQQELRHWGV